MIAFIFWGYYLPVFVLMARDPLVRTLVCDAVQRGTVRLVWWCGSLLVTGGQRAIRHVFDESEEWELLEMHDI